jgi:hypothetical protein
MSDFGLVVYPESILPDSVRFHLRFQPVDVSERESLHCTRQSGPTRHSIKEPEVLQRCPGIPATDVRIDHHFERRYLRKRDPIFFNFARCLRWAEVPLLPQDFLDWTFLVGRPSQPELLRARVFVFLKYQRDSLEVLKLIENQPNGLNTGAAARQPRVSGEPKTDSIGYSWSSEVNSTTAARSTSNRPSLRARIFSCVGVMRRFRM